MSDSAAEVASAIGERLYAGEQVAHRSCGIAIAETFGRETPTYQALRRGGLTGCGECGAIVAGKLVLGELYGDSSPVAPATEALKRCAIRYERLIEARLERREAPGTDRVCNTLTGQFESFKSHERHEFCTRIASMVAGAVAEVVVAESGDEFAWSTLKPHKPAVEPK